MDNNQVPIPSIIDMYRLSTRYTRPSVRLFLEGAVSPEFALRPVPREILPPVKMHSPHPAYKYTSKQFAVRLGTTVP